MSHCYVLLLLLPLVASQSFHWGRCPTPSVQRNFDTEMFLGRWYETNRLPTMHESGRCSQADFVRRDNNSMFITTSEIVGYHNTFEHGLLYQEMDEPAKMMFSYQTNNYFIDTMMPKCQWWVLKTDYTNMAVVYSCKDFMDMFYMEYAWIISRDRTLASKLLYEAMHLLYGEGIDISSMIEADQTNC